MVTARQVRAARASLDWTIDELAARAAVSPQTIRLFENGSRKPYQRTLEEIQRALQAQGIVFLEADESQGIVWSEAPVLNPSLAHDGAKPDGEGGSGNPA